MKSIVHFCAAAATAMLLSVAPAHAHHSFPATYQIDQTVKIKGKVVQFMTPRNLAIAGSIVPFRTGRGWFMFQAETQIPKSYDPTVLRCCRLGP